MDTPTLVQGTGDIVTGDDLHTTQGFIQGGGGGGGGGRELGGLPPSPFLNHHLS